MTAATLREQQTKAETVKALLIGLTVAERCEDGTELKATIEGLLEGIDAMYIPLSADARARRSEKRREQEERDLRLLEQVGAF